MPETKICTRCGEEKPLDAFGPRRKAPDGREARCRECNRDKQREYRRTAPPERLTPKRIAARRERVRRWNLENKEKKRAHKKVEVALENGSLIKPELCSRCARPGRIEAHHHDYSKPLEVEWICAKCHRHEHMSPDLAERDKSVAAFGDDQPSTGGGGR